MKTCPLINFEYVVENVDFIDGDLGGTTTNPVKNQPQLELTTGNPKPPHQIKIYRSNSNVGEPRNNPKTFHSVTKTEIWHHKPRFVFGRNLDPSKYLCKCVFSPLLY